MSDHRTTALQLLHMPLQALAHASPIQSIAHPVFDAAGVGVDIKRDDLLHPILSGNKLYKLWGHLQRAQALEAHSLRSFGGYYSNHLHALAYAGHCLGLQTEGVVRGWAPENLSPTLADCQRWGMTLTFVGRKAYQQATKLQDAVCERGIYTIPEGGGGGAGEEGCRALGMALADALEPNSTLCLAIGTGTTLKGVFAGLVDRDSRAAVAGFSALKLGDRLSEFRQQLVGDTPKSALLEQRLTLFDESVWGGFGKHPAELQTFMAHFEDQTGIALDPVYTGKMLYRVLQQVKSGRWARGTRLLVVHSGGLQGARGGIL